MIIKKLKILITIGLISLFVPIATSSKVIGMTKPIVNDYIIEGNDVFVEDFTTFDFRDSPETTTFGWGQGYVSSGRNFTFNPLDQIFTSDPVIELEMSGRRAYALLYNTTAGSDQLMSIDCTDPTSIGVMDTTNYWHTGSAFDMDGFYMYTGQASMSGYLFGTHNASDPTNLMGHWGYYFGDGQITDIDSEGRYVYFTIYGDNVGGSLACYDAMDPAVLSFPFYTAFPYDTGLGLTVEGRLAYVASGTNGLVIVNVTDVTNTPVVGEVAIPGNATDVIVDGRYAYVSTGFDGVFVVDIFDPTQPEVIGSLFTSGNARRMVKQGNTLIIADGPAGITIADVADPYNPVRVFGVLAGHVNDVALYGGLIGAASDDGIFIFQLGSSYAGVTNLNRASFINIFDGFSAWDVQVQGNIAYIAGGADGFYTLDVRYPESPILLDHWSQAGLEFKRLDVDGQYAYLVDTQNIVVFDISDPSNLRHISTITLFSSGVTDCFALGHELYMSWGGGTVVLFDMAYPGTASVSNATHELFLGNNMTSVWAQGRYCYTIDDSGASTPAIYTVSAHNVHLLAVTDSYTGGTTVMQDIFVDGEIAYTANLDWTITFDIFDPYNIVYGTADTFAADVCGVAGFGEYLLTADKSLGLVMYDVVNLGTLVPIAIIPELVGGLQVKTHGDYAYYVNQTGLSILRHFESAADTYHQGLHYATSTTINDNPNEYILEATLDANIYIPPGTDIQFQMTADGGAHWVDVTPGVLHAFNYPGYDLRWRAIIDGTTYRSAHIYDVNIQYTYNVQPSTPTIEDLGTSKFTGIFSVKWNESTDDVSIDHYELEMSDSMSFTTTLKSWITTKTSQTMFGLGKGNYYFRVRSVDNEGLASGWSFIESIEVKLATWLTGVIFGGGLLVVIIIVVVVSVVVRRKKKKVAIR